MKYFIVLFFSFSLLSCNSQINDSFYPGYRFSNFYDTDYKELAIAVKNNDVKEIENLITKNKLDVNFQENKFNMSLLCLAIVNNKKESFVSLLQLGADPNQICGTDKNETPLSISISFSDNCESFFLEKLLEYKADINKSMEYHKNGIKKINSPLFLLAFKTDDNGDHCQRFLDIFIKYNANFNFTFYDKTIDLDTNIIYYCLLYKNIIFLERLIISDLVKIPKVIDVSGFGKDKKEYTLIEVLKSDDFLFEDYPKERQAVLNILNYLEK